MTFGYKVLQQSTHQQKKCSCYELLFEFLGENRFVKCYVQGCQTINFLTLPLIADFQQLINSQLIAFFIIFLKLYYFAFNKSF